MIQRTTILCEQRFRVLWIPSCWTVFTHEGQRYERVHDWFVRPMSHRYAVVKGLDG